jgi:hypothetical protein
MAIAQANSLTKQVQTECTMQQGSSSTPSNSSMKLTAELWVRMEVLFKDLWGKRYGVPSRTNEDFVTWSRKLAALTTEDFGRAFDALEEEISKSVKAKKKVYPPSYAEFIGYSRPAAKCAIAAQQARQSEARPLMITKQATAEEMEYGKEQMNNLKGMFR